MQLSAPIYTLKRKAKLLARQHAIPLHEGLNRVAVGEGFQSWSHLAASKPTPDRAALILAEVDPGDMILLGARPGQGKTRLGLELAARAERFGRQGFFFTLDYHERDVADRLADLGMDPASVATAMIVDTSDAISADHIIARLERHSGDAVMVVDYLQLLDQKRTHPSLDDQVRSLRAYAKTKGAICVMISQIDRAFDLSGKAMPDLSDVRLPNPLDLTLFDKTCFLHEGAIHLAA